MKNKKHKGHSIANSMNDPSETQKKAFEEEQTGTKPRYKCNKCGNTMIYTGHDDIDGTGYCIKCYSSDVSKI